MTFARDGLTVRTLLVPLACLAAGVAPDRLQTGREDVRTLVAGAPFETIVPTLREASMVLPHWIEFLAFAGFEAEAQRLVKASDPTGAEGADMIVGIGLAIAGKVDEGLARVRSGNPDPVREHALAVLQASAGRLDDALATVRTMKTGAEEVRAKIAKGLARTNNPDAALPIARSLATGAYRAEALGLIGEALVRAGRHAEAIDLAKSLEGRDGAFPAHGVAGALAAAGRVGDALAVVDAIQAGLLQGMATSFVVNRLLESGHLGGALTAARRIQMPRAAASALAAVAAGLARGGQPELSRLVLTEALERLDEAHKTDQPADVEGTIADMAGRLASGGLIDEALALRGRVSEPSRRDEALEWVVRALVDTGRDERALAILESEAARMNANRRTSARRQIVSALATRLARSGNAAQALSDVRFASASDRAAVALGLAAGGAVEAATTAANRLEDLGVRDRTFCLMAEALAEARAYREARLAGSRCQGFDRIVVAMDVVRMFAFSEYPETRARLAALDAYRRN